MGRECRESGMIDGFTYKVTQLGAKEGRRVFARLVSTLGGAVGALAKEVMNASEGKQEGGVDAAQGVASFADRITPETLDFFCDTFSTYTLICHGATEQPMAREFDDHFAGRYAQMVQWLIFCIEVNFGSFLKGLGDIVALSGLQSKAK